MKYIIALLLFITLPARATVIEDSPERFVFDFGWTDYSMFGFGLDYPTRANANGGSYVLPGNASSNPYRYLVEVHRFIAGVRQPITAFQVLFTGDWERPWEVPDPVWGTATAPMFGLPADHVLAIPGNDHAVRVIYGLLPTPVPDSGGSASLLGLAMGALLVFAWRRS